MWMRIVGIVLLSLALVTIYTRARDEWRNSRPRVFSSNNGMGSFASENEDDSIERKISLVPRAVSINQNEGIYDTEVYSQRSRATMF